MSIDEAVDRTIEECIAEGILSDFLLECRAEVKTMSIYEYDDEKTKKDIASNAYEDGMADGKAEAKVQYTLMLLDKLGTIPEAVREKLRNTAEQEKLDWYFECAMKAESVGEFMEQANFPE